MLPPLMMPLPCRYFGSFFDCSPRFYAAAAAQRRR